MNPTAEQNGQIITFYSFKGGVGRTMTLANVAFLSALNGLRVLVMDWDLEAPGLAYYFRCLLDSAEAKELAEQPGVLDILWDWSESAKNVKSDQEFEALLADCKTGEAFERCTSGLYADDASGGVLHFIGAGSRRIDSCDLIYEDALAQFAWPTFFEERVGGVMLQELRRWAKANYDVVFVDSRTGLADVAGVCTMQLPDKVGLCFVLNRQNIDGVARVAAAIRSKREEQVGVRAIPMRVAGGDSGEASDAQAKAITELTRIGRFSRDAAREDLRTLSVFASNTIPYYETLAPILVDEPTKDPLTLNYASVASHIVGRDIKAVPLDREWVEHARSRLQPRLATIEYVTKLRSADPTRMVEELQRLIEGALDAAVDGKALDSEYVRVLVESVAAAEAMDPIEAVDIFPLAIELLRLLMVDDPSWRLSLIAALDRYVETCLYMLDEEDGLAILDELDGLLAVEPTIEAAVKRVACKRLALALLPESDGHERVLQASSKLREMIASLRQKVESVGQELAADQLDALMCAEVDSHLQSGIALDKRDMSRRALEELKTASSLISEIGKTKASPTMLRIGSQIHTYLACFTGAPLDETEAARHALEAMRWTSSLTLRARRFNSLAEAILKATTPSMMLDFCEAVLARQDRGVSAALVNNNGRYVSVAERFLSNIEQIVDTLYGETGERVAAVLSALGEVCNQILRRFEQRIASEKSEELSALCERMENIQLRIDANAALDPTRSAESQRRRPSPKADK